MTYASVSLLLALFFVILNILDIVTTRRALALGAREANPFARILMKHRLFIPAKILAAALILFIMYGQEPENAIWTGSLCCLLYTGVVINNIRAIKIQKSTK